MRLIVLAPPREVGLTEARQEAVEALRVLVEHFCYGERGLHAVADEAFKQRPAPKVGPCGS